MIDVMINTIRNSIILVYIYIFYSYINDILGYE